MALGLAAVFAVAMRVHPYRRGRLRPHHGHAHALACRRAAWWPCSASPALIGMTPRFALLMHGDPVTL